MGAVTVVGKTVFLSGPMTGKELYNTPAFAEAHAICKLAGARKIFDPAEQWLRSQEDEQDHTTYMRRCINELTQGLFNNMNGPMYERNKYEVLVQLEDWETSDGAVLEAQVAHACGIDVIGVRNIRPLATEE